MGGCCGSILSWGIPEHGRLQLSSEEIIGMDPAKAFDLVGNLGFEMTGVLLAVVDIFAGIGSGPMDK